MRYVTVLFALLLAVPASAAKFHDVPPGGGGGITIEVRPIERLEEAIVVEATEYKTYVAHIDKSSGRVTLKGIPPGKYDLVILGKGHVRIEGWEYAPVLEFDPFFPATATAKPDAREFIIDDIKKSRHYENKVEQLALGGDDKAIRVLVMLLRDLPTSYTPGAGTMRFEIWQYTWNYGGWVKEKRTRVMHRVLLQVSELRQWTWVWEPALGGIQLAKEPVTVKYTFPSEEQRQKLPGLHPY